MLLNKGNNRCNRTYQPQMSVMRSIGVPIRFPRQIVEKVWTEIIAFLEPRHGSPYECKAGVNSPHSTGDISKGNQTSLHPTSHSIFDPSKIGPPCLNQNSQSLHEIGQEEANDEESAAMLINEYRHIYKGKYQPQLHREKHALLWRRLPAPLRLG